MSATLMIRPGLLDRIKRYSGIASDDALAGAIGVSRQTLVSVRDGKQNASAQFIAGVCRAFDMSVGEVATLARPADDVHTDAA